MKSYLNKKKYYLLALVVLVMGGYYFATKNKNVTYTEYQVTRGSVNDTLELSGKVGADSVATLRFPAGGLVTYLGPKEGDMVKAWTTLASVDTRQTKKTLEQKLNLYAIQRGTFEQTIDDNDNSVPDGDLARTLRRLLEKNQYQLDNTVKDVEYLDLSLKLSRLTTPISGILVKSPIRTSNVQVLATDTWIVVNPETLYFSADLDEGDLARVKVGQKVRVQLDAYPDKTFDSTVASIAYTPKETSTGTVYELKVALEKSAMSELRLGLNGTATIILTEKNDAILLPSSAVTFEGIKTSVMIKDGDSYVEKEIETGIENEGMIEVLSGVTEGQYVYLPQK